MFLLLTIFSSSKTLLSSCAKCQKEYSKFTMGLHNASIKTDFPFCKGSEKCNKVASQLQNKFKDLVTTHDVCVSLGKCRPKPQPLSQNSPRKGSSSITLHETSNNCEFCQNLIEYLTGDGLKEISLPILTEFVKNVCFAMNFNMLCGSVNQANVDTLIYLVLAHFDTLELCNTAGFCQDD
ncbi:saposin family [Trichomonas vaginalis G3]|nr:saposin family [Trichomonas vaginalis G3]KAI5488684.1 saposin family [Trichomonas vaginalis G3]